MLKWYADTFKLDAAELTTKNLKRLKLYTILGLPSLPLMAYAFLNGFSDLKTLIAAILGVILSFFMCVVMMSRFTNRFWARDKYLDEWERGRKHHAMAIGHQVTDYLFVMLAVIFFIAAQFSKQSITLNFETLASIAMAVVVFMVLVPHIFLLWTVKPVDIKGEVEEAEFEQSSKRNLRLWIIVGAILISGFIFGFFSAHEGGAAYDLGYNFGRWLGGVFKGG